MEAFRDNISSPVDPTRTTSGILVAMMPSIALTMRLSRTLERSAPAYEAGDKSPSGL
jgi:hypothetical protein